MHAFYWLSGAVVLASLHLCDGTKGFLSQSRFLDFLGFSAGHHVRWVMVVQQSLPFGHQRPHCLSALYLCGLAWTNSEIFGDAHEFTGACRQLGGGPVVRKEALPLGEA